MPLQQKFCPDNLASVVDGVYTFDGVICDTQERTQATDTRDHTLGTCPDCSDPIWITVPDH